jgi:hypothetical protein
MAYTDWAKAEIWREKDFTPEETLAFLRNPENFLTVREGIIRELGRLGISGSDEELFERFTGLILENGLNSNAGTKAYKKEIEDERSFFFEEKLPNRSWAVKLCFAFGLDECVALDFLWKVCKLNGFNVRRAEDVVYCYCLENGRSYADARAIITEYKSQSVGQAPSKSTYTARTHALRGRFEHLKGVVEADFKAELFKNTKNFIGYSLTAHEEMESVYNAVIKELREQTNFSLITSGWLKLYRQDGEPQFNKTEVFNYLTEKMDNDSRPIKGKSPLSDYVAGLASFFTVDKLKKVVDDEERATESEYGSARKIYVFLYFAEQVLSWERYVSRQFMKGEKTGDLFSDFLIGLNEQLCKCGYGYLYYANPFDWHILNCVQALDESVRKDCLDPLTLYNEVLARLADE